jgi:probable F420-dependent oxidoreductase
MRGGAVKTGIFIFPTAQSIAVATLAKHAEAAGFESIWIPEHPILPVNPKTPFPGSPDGVIPEVYAHLVDPFIGLATAASVTSTIKLGTGICLIPERHPLITAKAVATLDHYSRGRFLLGIGAGWLREETEIFGANFERRWSWTRECMLAMKELWTKDEAEFHGEFIHFPPVQSSPKPFQKPHPPIILGGHAKNVLRRVVEYGNGWMPNRIPPDQVKAARDELNKLAAQAGRDPKSIEISVFGLPNDADLVQQFVEAGADRVVIRLNSAPERETLAELAQVASRILK